jgi:hypothetical protein
VTQARSRAGTEYEGDVSLTMVILAAGMGTRFGGPKQLVGVGPSGECVLDYNAHDVVGAGFTRLVVVTRPELEDEVHAVLDRGAAGRVTTDVVLQRVPDDRSIPWGTAEATALGAADVDGPFGVCNSDDLYGPGSFRILGDHLRATPDEGALVGFALGSTVPPEGEVSRALVRTDGSRVVGVTELHGIDRAAVADRDALCSMNLWGMPASFLPQLRRFVDIGQAAGPDELLLPDAVQAAIDGGLVVRLLPSDEPWAGLTNPGDLGLVRARAASGWPSPLWGPR